VTEKEVVVSASAKVNLALRVVALRPDRYHEIESLVVPISLTDSVTLRADSNIAFSMRGVGPPIAASRNLAKRAAEEWWQNVGGSRCAAIDVEKRIPVAAGLGGGSADAAAVLRGMNQLWGNRLSDERLAELGTELGSDVPALLRGGPVVVLGRGERVESVSVPTLWLVIVPLGFGVSSSEAYRWWDEDGAGSGPPIDLAVKAAARGDLDELAAAMRNDLEPPVVSRHPELARAREQLADAGSVAAVMSGSGPTVVGLAREESHAVKIAEQVPGSIVVSSIDRPGDPSRGDL
jgi:4-diphosphocytidyl-2-C-methyl-D-erythritol kinase